MAKVALALQPPWYTGAGGATLYTRHEAQRFARTLVEDQTYRDNLTQALRDRTVHASVEQMLWHYAYGKPIEQISMNLAVGPVDLSTLSMEELQKQALEVAKQLEEAQALQDAIDAVATTTP